MKLCINLLVLILVGGGASLSPLSQLLPNISLLDLINVATCGNVLQSPGSCYAPPNATTLTVDCPRGVEPKETKKLGKSSEQIASSMGYQPETHSVDSQGYTIRLVRIPSNSSSCTSKSCCLVVHGLLQGDHDWFTGFNKTSLPFKLNDKGCDTWVVSLRGTVGSSTYNKSVTGQPQYNFTLDDMAIYDMPAIVDYIMSNATCTKVNLFGISMGGAIITGFLAEHPSYKNKICSASLMSPAIYLGGMTSPVVNILDCAIRDNGLLRQTNDLLLNQSLSSPLWAFLKYIGTNCVNNNLNITPCGIAMNALFGTPDHQLGATSDNNLAMAFSINQLPNWITIKTLIQLFDFIKTNQFCKYNVDPNAPCDAYNMANIDTTTTDINVYYGYCDSLVVPGSAKYLEAAVPGVKSYFMQGMNHVDHTYSIGLDCYYDQMISKVSSCICS